MQGMDGGQGRGQPGHVMGAVPRSQYLTHIDQNKIFSLNTHPKLIVLSSGPSEVRDEATTPIRHPRLRSEFCPVRPQIEVHELVSSLLSQKCKYL